ncbi:Uma2 family endonuclease [Candidatus Thiosymbion oneisti]|uniref:Uma2 family endonuclease n=1 Tax=Candidatus Thiosymbion oneisti TaxID=589554 RepID=UPI000B01CEFD|nr:Uma2 family endonuclease [Candidatus Thiosymbion oneisti]
MPQPVPTHQPTLYEALEALPEGVVGEILNGQLHTQPRPAIPHAHVAARFDRSIGRSYGDGIDGPGGWWIFPEPEVHFVRDVEVAVPDLAGWHRERMPILPTGHRVEVVPDWVCEILSPSTKRKDRKDKMPLYARYGVQYAWLTDPVERTLEVYRLNGNTWIEVGRFAGADQVRVPPFEAVSIDLEGLWLPQQLRLVER